MRKTASSFIASLLFLSLFAFTLSVRPAKAELGTIYINADGSINSPVPANITSDKVTYNFTENNYLPIVVNRSNIIINGKGHTLQVSSLIGFFLTGMSNVTIENTTITNCAYGIWLDHSSGNVLSGNNVTANDYGIKLVDSYNDTLSGNNVAANSHYGIWLGSSSGNVLSGNNVTANSGGIALDSSSGNVLSGNVMAGNGQNFGFFNDYLSDFANSVDTSNLIEGKPVYYLVNQSNIDISPQRYPGGVGYLGLFNCKNVTVQGLTIEHNAQGILLANTTDSKITDNKLTANRVGVELWSSSGNVLSGNNVTANGAGGIWLDHSSDNGLSGNNVAANGKGVELFSFSGNNTLSGNNVTANDLYGIVFSGSGNNMLYGNYVANSHYGIGLFSTSDNRIFHNDFSNNTQQTVGIGVSLSNALDDDYPSGGNYWSNYNGTDLYSGRYQNATGSDGIGDTPYIIDANNTDHYPLMAPFKTFDAGAWNGTSYHVDVVSNSTLSGFEFNATARTLRFNVTGMDGTEGFSRVAIPKGLMWSESDSGWAVMVNGTLSGNRLIINDSSYTYIHFTYHHSTQPVQIQSTYAVPEFQPTLIIPPLITVTLLAALGFNTKRRKPQQTET